MVYLITFMFASVFFGKLHFIKKIPDKMIKIVK